jgi:hypothetical protein
MYWIDLAQVRDHWRTVMKTAVSVVSRILLGNSWIGGRLAASEGFSSMEADRGVQVMKF